MLNLVLSLTQYWFSISFCPWGEILKRPMKRVQDDRKGFLKALKWVSFCRGFYHVIRVESLALNYFSNRCIHTEKVGDPDHSL